MSAKSDPIYAMSDEEAHAFVGKKVVVSEREVIFGQLRCEVAKRDIQYTRDEDLKVFSAKMLFIPGYPYSVNYDCRDKEVSIPGFNVGKSCDKILAEQDGWTFFLRRLR